VYPGIAGHPTDTVGDGETRRYSGFGVMVCSEALPHIRRAVSAATDSLIDMSGPGAVTVYSTLRYLVLTIETAPELELVEWNEALRGALHRVADDLAGHLADLEPPKRQRFALDLVSGNLPRVVHVHTLNASMVPGIGTGIYGYTPHALPVLLHPNEILDGAIAGDAVVGYPGKCTWLHVNTKNNPVCYVEWGWHVAPTLCVRGKWFWRARPMVIDPSLFKTPVTKATWKSVQGDPGATLTDSAGSIFYLWGSVTDDTYSETNSELATYRLQLQNRALMAGPPPYAACP